MKTGLYEYWVTLLFIFESWRQTYAVHHELICWLGRHQHISDPMVLPGILQSCNPRPIHTENLTFLDTSQKSSFQMTRGQNSIGTLSSGMSFHPNNLTLCSSVLDRKCWKVCDHQRHSHQRHTFHAWSRHCLWWQTGSYGQIHKGSQSKLGNF